MNEAVEYCVVVVSKVFGDKIPAREHDNVVVSSLLKFCYPPDMDDAVRTNMAAHLVEALDLLRRQQSCQWAN